MVVITHSSEVEGDASATTKVSDTSFIVLIVISTLQCSSDGMKGTDAGNQLCLDVDHGQI